MTYHCAASIQARPDCSIRQSVSPTLFLPAKVGGTSIGLLIDRFAEIGALRQKGSIWPNSV